MDLLVLRRLVEELAPRLKGARIDQVYALPDDHLALVVGRRSAPRLWFAAEPEHPHLYERRGKHATPKTPPGFAMAGRKLLAGRRIEDLELVGGDRVVALRCFGEDPPRLVFEIIPRRATATLIDGDGVVRAVWKQRRGRPRPGEPYTPPRPDARRRPDELTHRDWAALEDAADDEALARGLLRALREMSQLLAREIVAHRRATGAALPAAVAAEIERARADPAAAVVYTPAPLDDLIEPPAPPDFVLAPYPLRHLEEPASGAPLTTTRFGSLAEAAAAYYPRRAELFAVDSARREADNRIGIAIAKLQRQLEAIAADAAGFDEPDTYRRRGDLLLAHPEARRENGHALVPDDYGDGEIIRIAVDPSAPLSDSAQRYYRKARRAERSRDRVAKRRRVLRARVGRLEDLHRSIASLHDLASCRELTRAAGRAGVRLAVPGAKAAEAPHVAIGDSPKIPVASGGKAAAAGGSAATTGGSGAAEDVAAKRSPSGTHRRAATGVDAYTTADGAEILVGRNARGNERLTHKMAAPHDFWLHADGPGSHVLIRNPTRAAEPSSGALYDAAALAAYFSYARGATKVNVQWTQARHVRKPRGAPTGQVIVRQAKTVLAAPTSPQELFAESE